MVPAKDIFITITGNAGWLFEKTHLSSFRPGISLVLRINFVLFFLTFFLKQIQIIFADSNLCIGKKSVKTFAIFKNW